MQCIKRLKVLLNTEIDKYIKTFRLKKVYQRPSRTLCISSGNIYNHSIFTLNELNYGMSKLVGNGYVVRRNNKFFATDKARAFYEYHSNKKEGCIETLFRLSPLFQKEIIKQDCKLTTHFIKDTKGKIRVLKS